MPDAPPHRRRGRIGQRHLFVALGLAVSMIALIALASRTGAGGSPKQFTDVATPEMAEAKVYSEGGCWSDIDGDGDQDLLVLNVRDPIRLWQNEGDGRFRDITASALTARFVGPAMCAFVDLDNDGDLDLYVTERQAPSGHEWLGRLLVNDRGIFREVTAVTGARMFRAAANAVDWADMDGDGDLDAFIGGRYVRGQPRQPRHNYLFEQVGPLRFRDVAPTKQLSAGPSGGQNVFLGSWMDYDADGDPDLLVAIDFWGVELYRNDRGNFTQVTNMALPPATDETPGAPPNNAMGAAWGDYDNDGCIDVFITGVNILGQGGFDARHLTDLASRLYRNTCDGRFEDVTLESGLRPTGIVEWSTNFIDYDNDGDLDLSVVAGYVGVRTGDGVSTRADNIIGLIVKYPRKIIPPRLAAWLYRYEAMIPAAGQSGPEAAMPKLLYRNQLVETGKATFVNVSYSVGVADVSASRASLWADMDNDGDLDWFVPARRTANRLFRNDGPVGNYLRVHLIGASHRQAIGSWVKIRADGRQQLRHVHVLDGYLSQSQLDPHFGLGQARTVDEIAVRWPGTTNWIMACRNVPAGRTVTVREGGGCSW